MWHGDTDEEEDGEAEVSQSPWQQEAQAK